MGLEFDMVTTRGGDSGQSSLLNSSREYKDSEVFNLLGDLDELNAYLGVIRKGFDNMPKLSRQLRIIQRLIIERASSQVASGHSTTRFKFVTNTNIERIEKWMKGWMEVVIINPVFLIPGDRGMDDAFVHVARTVCRRAERSCVSVIRERGYPIESVQRFLNRLSDYLFILCNF